LVGSSAVDVTLACVLAAAGLAMAPLPLAEIAAVVAASAAFAVLLDFAKVPVFRRLAFA
jgi:H+-transporting ATPase